MITSITIVLLLIVFGFSGQVARADHNCGASCRGGGMFHHAEFVPNVTYYAPYPHWFPQYFGPPQSDYLVVQYAMPPAETAAFVKQRILAFNAANPALLPAPKAALPPPKPDNLPPPQK